MSWVKLAQTSIVVIGLAQGAFSVSCTPLFIAHSCVGKRKDFLSHCLSPHLKTFVRLDYDW